VIAFFYATEVPYIRIGVGPIITIMSIDIIPLQIGASSRLFGCGNQIPSCKIMSFTAALQRVHSTHERRAWGTSGEICVFHWHSQSSMTLQRIAMGRIIFRTVFLRKIGKFLPTSTVTTTSICSRRKSFNLLILNNLLISNASS
jgi:hypothetical protein